MTDYTQVRRGGRRRLKKWVIVLGWVIILPACLALGIGLGCGYAVYRTSERLPDFKTLRSIPSGTTIRYLATDGSVLHSTGPVYGEWIEYARIPLDMRRAIVAIEDRRFRSHTGVDPMAVARAIGFAWENKGTGRRMQGASTITQQVARTLFLTRRYDFKRKIDEMIVALAMEQVLTKEQILELYLNRVYFGGGAYGIDAASRRYFGHPANKLTVAEAALLAGLPKAPSSYAPTADPKAALGRMKVVLAKMRETRQLPDAPLDPAAPKFHRAEVSTLRTASRHFTDWIEPQLEMLSPGLRGRIDVHTTLSPPMQAAAIEAVSDNVPKDAQTALVAMEEGGAIRSMIGGLDYPTSTYNRATQSQRQPGSAFKLFVYLSALEAGYRPDSAVYDGPISIRGWSPHNSSGRYSGLLPMRQAFAWSLNTVAARLGQDVGVGKIAGMAHRLGISSPLATTPSLVLGTSDVRLIDMTRAYASVASLGRSVVPYGVERIEQDGKTVYAHEESTTQQIVAADIAGQMVTMMRGTVDAGTGQAADFGRPAAGKTGTTNSNKDGWFIGFSGGLVTGVWVGRDDAAPVPGLQGGRNPARTFAQYMKIATANRPAVVTLSPLPSPTNRTPVKATQMPDAPAVTRQSPPSTAVPVAVNAPPPDQALPPPERNDGRSRAIRPD